MKRLTNRDKKPISLTPQNEIRWMAIYHKLKQYEDAEENGLLVRLPCRVSEFLFAPTRDFVSIFQVTGFEYSGYDVFVKWKLCKGIIGRFKIDGIYKSEIGKIVFLTQKEADAKLKEMEGENADSD